MSELYIGLMSGTSLDGIDAVIARFKPKAELLGHCVLKFEPTLRQQILDLCSAKVDSINQMAQIDRQLGCAFAQAVNELLTHHPYPRQSIKAIGSHGQTIRHYPSGAYGFSWQIGDPNTIAALTQITTVADFRRRDVALGGQGAPLVPAFHHAIFASPQQPRVIVNIGGIANITLLSANAAIPVIGYDTGPGNVLLDYWFTQHNPEQTLYDPQGQWGKQGQLQPDLLKQMLDTDFFKLSAPKSTGRELFNSAWLRLQLETYNQEIRAVDVQATLVHCTACSIAQQIQLQGYQAAELYLCGGGAHNQYLVEVLQSYLPEAIIQSTGVLGVDPDWVEAMAFAWLAQQTLQHLPGNIPSVTGASRSAILGGIYPA